jgi:hypothetical protein
MIERLVMAEPKTVADPGGPRFDVQPLVKRPSDALSGQPPS